MVKTVQISDPGLEAATRELPLVEAFYTIQGEGYHQGRAAYFIRLGGCDVGCVWCDVKESWNASLHPVRTVDSIVEEALQYPSRLAVVTGGEPLMHDCRYLTALLHRHGYATHIETSGAYPVSGDWDWICLSPKKFKAPLPEILPLANELKVVIFNHSDFKWAEKFALQANPGCRLYLQPEWSKAGTVIPWLVEYIKEHPRWELSLQIHKYIHVP
jgi:organic radical activating enzyme